MVADVPLGAFLSGGIDSSMVVALMQRASRRPVRTFSIGFAEREHDEAPFARAIAAHLGTDHTELRVTPAAALDVIPRLSRIYDEPFGDSSAIPTTLLSMLTRRHVTVALSGDGGDELFGGYTRYTRAERAWQRRGLVPASARPLASAALRGMGRLGAPGHRDRLDRFSRLIASRHPVEQYGAMTSYWDAALLLPGVEPYATVATDPAGWQEFADPTQSLMYADALMYLPDDILVKVDRASMSASLEARVPLLDHRVVEHAWALPRRMRVRDGVRKWILRQVLARHVPPALFERPKAGFGVPLAGWLRGPLRDWVEPLLAPAALADAGLAPHPVVERWRAHLAGADTHTDHLWIVLMFQAWLESGAARGGAAVSP
jgi:asparagine synthase (glutamine-hydrolysing)